MADPWEGSALKQANKLKLRAFLPESSYSSGLIDIPMTDEVVDYRADRNHSSFRFISLPEGSPSLLPYVTV